MSMDRRISARIINAGLVLIALGLLGWTVFSNREKIQEVLSTRPDFGRLAATGHKVGVAAVHAAAGPDAIGLDVRGFAPHLGVNEDPVTGSLNASLAQWLIAEGLLPGDYQAAQGAALGRAGRVHIRSDPAGQVWVGGQSVTCIDGTVTL